MLVAVEVAALVIFAAIMVWLEHREFRARERDFIHYSLGQLRERRRNDDAKTWRRTG